MITINLLSTTQKQELKIKRIYVAIKEMVMLLLLFTSFSALLLVGSRYYLNRELSDLISRNAVFIQAGREINNQILIINKKINEADKIQKDFKKWSGFIAQISDLSGSEITYTALKIYRQDYVLELNGSAKNRQSLLDFKKRLEASGLFKEINLPISNLINKENNVFIITAKIDPTKIP